MAPHYNPNSTNPKTIDATGYMPYLLRRQKFAEKENKDSKASKAFTDLTLQYVKQKMHDAFLQYVHDHDKDLFRSKWECEADKRCLHERVKFEMDKIMEDNSAKLRDRKLRLKDILEKESDKFDGEVKALEEPAVKSRQDMLERYKEIMTKKEFERRKVVEAKKEQQFRNNCPELRAMISEKICKIVAEEGKNLNEEKTRFTQQKLEEEKMYDEAWRLDAEAKERRELERDRIRKEKDVQFGKSLFEQFQHDRSSRSSNLKSQEDEAQLVKEQQRLLELEKEWELAEKRMKQERLKKDLDKCLKSKLKRRAREVQEDLMLDLYFLDKILNDNSEAQKLLEKKMALKKEQDEYLAYLASQVQRECEFEKAVDRLQEQETNRMWEKREKEWEAERKRREVLNRKNMRQLHEQIRNKREMCQLVEQRKIQYDEEIKKQAEFDRKYLDEEKQLAKQERLRSGQELMNQIKQKESFVKELKRKEVEELQKLKDLQDEYDDKIEKIIADATIPNLHPYRSSNRM